MNNLESVEQSTSARTEAKNDDEVFFHYHRDSHPLLDRQPRIAHGVRRGPEGLHCQGLVEQVPSVARVKVPGQV